MTDQMETSELALSERPHLAPYVRLQWDSTRQKYIMVAPESLVVLNDTAFSALILCNGMQTIAEIVAELNDQYRSDVTREVRVLLTRLLEKRLIALNRDVARTQTARQ